MTTTGKTRQIDNYHRITLWALARGTKKDQWKPSLRNDDPLEYEQQQPSCNCMHLLTWWANKTKGMEQIDCNVALQVSNFGSSL